MLDINWIQANPERLDAALRARGQEPRSHALTSLNQERRERIAELQLLQTERNRLSKSIGIQKAEGLNTEAEAAMRQVSELKSSIPSLEEKVRQISDRLDLALADIPNIPLEFVPIGTDESANVMLKQVGEIPKLSEPIRDHVAIGEGLGGMDLELAARLSGSRFSLLTGALAKLERVLGQYMLEHNTKSFGYQEVSVPVLVRSACLRGTGHLDKFAHDQFATSDDLWLIPTAEVPLTNFVREEILSEPDLPMRLCALTPCFRREAGAAGRDTHGIMRLHQFWKVELVAITTPEQEEAEHRHMVGCAESILQSLEIPYRAVELCTGDLGFSARRTIDLEVWLPGQQAYREISSCSMCGPFQARRLNARYRRGTTGERALACVHTLNGSGLAVGRTLIAVLENYQNPDGSVTIPSALRPAMGVDRISV